MKVFCLGNQVGGVVTAGSRRHLVMHAWLCKASGVWRCWWWEARMCGQGRVGQRAALLWVLWMRVWLPGQRSASSVVGCIRVVSQATVNTTLCSPAKSPPCTLPWPSQDLVPMMLVELYLRACACSQRCGGLLVCAACHTAGSLV
jgi:hypothetical protein